MLSAEGYEVVCAADAEAALRQLDVSTPELVLCDLRMPGMDGLELLPQLVRRLPEATVILMSAYGTAELAIEAMKRGAYDYLAKPFAPSEVLLALRKARERERLRRANQLLRREVERASGEHPIVAASEPMIEVLEVMERAAGFKATVLLTGESGTGKEVLARAIHAQSPRRGEAFVAVNCAAIPEALLESELFGHAKGAFTGADRARRGLFLEADGGTLFLDEVGELAHAAAGQAPARAPGGGGPAARRVEVAAAWTCACSRPPRATWRPRSPRAASARISSTASTSSGSRCRRCASARRTSPCWWTISWPASATRSASRCAAIADEALEKLVAYRWPGNVRELENVIERAIILAELRPHRPRRAAAERGRAPAGSARRPAAPASSRCAARGGWSSSR